MESLASLPLDALLKEWVRRIKAQREALENGGINAALRLASSVVEAEDELITRVEPPPARRSVH